MLLAQETKWTDVVTAWVAFTPANKANGAMGYIPTRRAYAEGGSAPSELV